MNPGEPKITLKDSMGGKGGREAIRDFTKSFGAPLGVFFVFSTVALVLFYQLVETSNPKRLPGALTSK